MGFETGGQILDEWLKDVPLPAWKRPRAKDDLREKAIQLRKKGWSYREIREVVPVSKSSLSLWLKDVVLTEEHKARLAMLKLQGSSKAGETNQARRIAREQAIIEAAAAQVGLLAESELFVAGLVAYWAEGAKTKPWRRQNTVDFINSDPTMVLLFLAWLRLLGIGREELTFYLSIHESADLAAAHAFWKSLIGAGPDRWRQPVLKRHNPKTVRKNVGDDYHGCLGIYVHRSSELYQRIEGWWLGVSRIVGSVGLSSLSGVV